MNTKTALIVAYYFPPIGMGGVQRMAKLAKYLPEHGYDVIVLTVKPIRYAAHDPTLLEELPAGVEIFRAGSYDPARIAKLIPLPLKVGTVVKRSASSQSSFWPDSKIGWKNPAIRLASRIRSKHKIDIMLSSSPPITGHMVAMEMKKKSGIPWVADFRDFWQMIPPEDLYTDQQLIDKSNGLLNEIGSVADAVTRVNDAINLNMADLISTIRGGYDPDDFVNLSPRTSGNKFELCYMGTVGPIAPIDSFFQAANMAVQSDSDFATCVKFKFIGVNEESDVIAAAKRHNLADKLEMVGYLPHKEALKEATTAAVMLMSVHQKYPGIQPGKVFDYIALPAPTLAEVPAGGEAEKVINKYQAGICIEPCNPGLLAEAMLNLFRDFCKGDKWKKGDLSGFTRKESAGQLARLFDRILNGGT
jgi:glycosyltransferase involved in cell wall biosynthesis